MPLWNNIVLGVRYSLDNSGSWIVLAILGLYVALSRRTAPAGIDEIVRERVLMCRALLVGVGAHTSVRLVLFPEHDVRLAAPAIAILIIVLLTIASNIGVTGSGRKLTPPPNDNS